MACSCCVEEDSDVNVFRALYVRVSLSFRKIHVCYSWAVCCDHPFQKSLGSIFWAWQALWLIGWVTAILRPACYQWEGSSGQVTPLLVPLPKYKVRLANCLSHGSECGDVREGCQNSFCWKVGEPIGKLDTFLLLERELDWEHQHPEPVFLLGALAASWEAGRQWTMWWLASQSTSSALPSRPQQCDKKGYRSSIFTLILFFLNKIQCN